MIRTLVPFLLAGLMADPVAAFELKLPGAAREISERISPLDSYALPVGPFASGVVPVRVLEGRVERRTWRINTPGLTTLQVLAPLRTQLVAEGFEVEFQCHDTECGGFDFRFDIEVIAAPSMYVDIRDYRFLAVSRGGDEVLGLLASGSLNAAYLQVIHVNPGVGGAGDAAAPESEPEVDVSEEGDADEGAMVRSLLEHGHVILPDLVFSSGATRLDDGRYGSLERLARFMVDNPGIRVAMVGHTDSIGTLDQNIVLSRARAQSVRARLIEAHGIAADRIDAEGMGYLSPIASNLDPDGREANRRVEVIILSDR